jgi:hypothetical protein
MNRLIRSVKRLLFARRCAQDGRGSREADGGWASLLNIPLTP